MVYFGDFVRRFALGFAIFTSAFLLSQVQLLLGKFLLPWFGGTFRNDFVLLTRGNSLDIPKIQKVGHPLRLDRNVPESRIWTDDYSMSRGYW
jgi:hypothetical protein